MFNTLRALLPPALASLLGGCTWTGAAPHELMLLYPQRHDLPSEPLRLAPQLHLDVLAQVQNAQKRYTVALTHAISTDPSVVEASLLDGVVRLSAKAPGQAQINVEGVISPGAQTARRSLSVVVSAPAKVTLTPLSLEQDPVYLAGRPWRIGLRVEDASGMPLWGHGPAPVSVRGQAALGQVADWQSHVIVVASPTPGLITLRSTLDDSELTLRTIALTQIDGLRLEDAGELKVGQRRGLMIWPTAQGATVLQAELPVEVHSRSPQRCVLQIERTRDDDLSSAQTLLQLEALEPGECAFTLQLGELSVEHTLVIS